MSSNKSVPESDSAEAIAIPVDDAIGRFPGSRQPKAYLSSTLRRLKTSTTRRLVWISAICAVLVSVYFLCTMQPNPGAQVVWGRTLAASFEQLQGGNRELLVDIFSKGAPDSMRYLAQQMNRKDSFWRAHYISLWPKLPKFLRSKLKQPKPAAVFRIQAISILRTMGTRFTTSDVGLATLVAAFDNFDIQVRTVAEGAIGDIGPKAKAAVPALLRSVQRRGPIPYSPINGMWALGRIGPDANSAIPLLESIVRAKQGRERVYAAQALLRIGGDREMALAALQESLTDQNREARWEADRALQRATFIGPPRPDDPGY